MLIFIANQFVGDKVSTGGDVLAMEIAKRVTDKITILAPSQIHPEIKKSINHVSLIDTDSFQVKPETASSLLGGALTVLHYFIRSWSATIWLFKNVRDDDVIYLTGDFICNTLPTCLIKNMKPGIKVLVNFYHRNPPPRSRPGNNYLVSIISRYVQGVSLKIIKKIAFKIFVLSKIGKNELIDEMIPSTQIVVSGAGINIYKKRRNLPRKRNQIVYVGRMNITKGVFDLIEIFSLVHQYNNKLNLVLAGGTSESDLNRLNGLINQFDLQGNIKYLGFVSDEEKYRILSESKVTVLPSKEEGFGIVIMESIAVGTPVVCYDIPALRVVFSKYKSVSLVKSFDKSSFADTILRITSSICPREKEKPITWDDVFDIQAKYF